MNEKKISYAVWNLSDKYEASALFVPGFEPDTAIRDEDMKEQGRWIREIIKDRGTVD